MPETSPAQATAKDVFAVIKKSPSLMITLAVVSVAVVYYYYKKSSAAASTAAASTSTQPSQFAPAMGTYTFVEDIHQASAPTPITIMPAPVTVINQPTQAPPPILTPMPIPKKVIPLIPYGKWPVGVKWVTGNSVTWSGKLYTLEVGSSGRIWGLPGRVSASQIKNTTIPPKFLLYGTSPSYY